MTDAGQANGAAATVGADGKGVTVGEVAAQNNSSASSGAPFVGASDKPAAPDFKTSLGDFAKDPAFAAFNDLQGLAKSYKETKSLVGQKLGIPDANATPEAKALFYKSLGVPEKAEEYGFQPPENIPEALKGSYNTELLNEFAGKAKELNLTKDQAVAMQKWFDNKQLEAYKGMEADTSRSDEEFDKLATSMFGDKKSEALQSANAILQKAVPEALRADFANMPNAALLGMAAVAKHFSSQSGEDKVLQNIQGSPAKSVGELKNEARELMKDPAYSSPMAKGREAHETLVKKVKEIYAQVDVQSRKAV